MPLAAPPEGFSKMLQSAINNSCIALKFGTIIHVHINYDVTKDRISNMQYACLINV